jgi:hypothetical protein
MDTPISIYSFLYWPMSCICWSSYSVFNILNNDTSIMYVYTYLCYCLWFLICLTSEV